MSDFYKIPRGANWNFNPAGQNNFKLSRSKIDLFLECPRCFYLDNKLGLKRPPGYPFNLNSAVDALLKKEFDIHRAGATTHPLMEKYEIKAVPFEHPSMNEWRDNFNGLKFFYEPINLWVTGAVDDIWINDEGELHVVDYKSTSKESEVNLDAEWQEGYKRQVEVYEWLLRKMGFKVSDTAYFVYANGLRDKEAFDGKLEFDVKIIPYKGSDKWVEKTLMQIRKTLEGGLPGPNKDCDYCLYRKTVMDVLGLTRDMRKEIRDKKKEDEDIKTGKKGEQESLF